MLGRPQWALWRKEQRSGKTTKMPYQVRHPNLNASHSDPATWASFDEAVSVLSRGEHDGLMFAFSETDNLVGVDLDDCIKDGVLEPWAARIVEAFASYSELSPSGKGLHIILKGKLPGEKKGRKKGPVEVYEALRFFTVTAKAWGKLEHRQAELERFYAEHFPPKKPSTPKKVMPVSLDDQKLLELMFASRSGSSIAALWQGDYSAYPSQSEADLALLGYLAWWTGYDMGRTVGLFERSGLYREKWEREDYRAAQLELVFG